MNETLVSRLLLYCPKQHIEIVKINEFGIKFFVRKNFVCKQHLNVFHDFYTCGKFLLDWSIDETPSI